MMNRRLLMIAALGLVFTAAFAQRRKPAAKPAAPPSGAAAQVEQRKPVLEVAIGKSGSLGGGEISKTNYDAIASQGIHLKDPRGGFIEGFTFTYGERNMYEDSVGNDKPVTEYLTEYCTGDSLTSIIANTISFRTKPGDTAYYDEIHVRLPDGKAALGKPMKFVITR